MINIVNDPNAVAGIPAKVVLTQDSVPFNVYVKINDKKFILVATANNPISKDKIKKYMTRGAEYLYLLIQDKDSLLNGSERAKLILKEVKTQAELEGQEKLHDQADEIKVNASEVLKKIAESKMNKIDPQLAEETVKITEGLIQIVSKDHNIIEDFLALSKVSDYFYNHAIGCSAFTIAFLQYLTKDTYLGGYSSPKNVKDIGLAALLCNVGNKFIEPEILNKNSQLTGEEFIKIQSHPTYSCKLLERMPGMNRTIYDTILQHHESWNGSGYPNHKKAKEISLPARVLAITDAFTAMVLNRPYADKYSIEKTLEIMFMEEGKYDHELLEKFFQMFKDKLNFKKM